MRSAGGATTLIEQYSELESDRVQPTSVPNLGITSACDSSFPAATASELTNVMRAMTMIQPNPTPEALAPSMRRTRRVVGSDAELCRRTVGTSRLQYARGVSSDMARRDRASSESFVHFDRSLLKCSTSPSIEAAVGARRSKSKGRN